MNKPAHFFDINYTGSDIMVDGFAVRSKVKQTHGLSEICGLNNRYSVRATVDIKQGQVIEECYFAVMHSLKLSKDPSEGMAQMDILFVLEDQSQFTKDNGPRLISASGNAAFYRSYFDPNAYVVYDNISKILQIKALRDIPSGHEITLYRYGSLQVMKNNAETQKFYLERQKQIEENKVNTTGFRSMQGENLKNIETVEVKSE